MARHGPLGFPKRDRVTPPPEKRAKRSKPPKRPPCIVCGEPVLRSEDPRCPEHEAQAHARARAAVGL